jgi:hypothetical protein
MCTRRFKATASERHRYSDTANVTAHFGIHRRRASTASERRRCNRISPTRWCLLTQLVGMASKSTKAAENVYAPLLGQGKGHLPTREYIIMDRLIPILTPLSSHWTVPLSEGNV